MAIASSNIIFLVLFFLLFSTPAAQELLETSPAEIKSTTTKQELLKTSPVDLKYTTKRLHRISVQLSSLLAKMIDSAADEVATARVEGIRELLAVISGLESLLNQCGMRGFDVLAPVMVPTLESLKYVISSLDSASISLPSSTLTDEFSNLLKRLISLISSLELLDITALVTA